MPTGYTHNITRGQSFEDFVLNCSRNFGACVSQRDEPAGKPELNKVSDYHSRALKSTREKLNILYNATEEEVEEIYEKKFQEELEYHLDAERRRKRANRQYKLMLQRVRFWTPPTDQHENLKYFMEDQIQLSIETYVSDAPERIDASKWHYKKIKKYEEDIEYHIKKGKEDAINVAEKNKWITDLYDSLQSKVKK